MPQTLYDLTPAQMSHYVKIQEYKTQQVANICVLMTLKSYLNFGMLKQCIQLEYDRCECLRTRFTAPDAAGKIQQYIVPQETRDIRYENFSGLSNEEAYGRLAAWSKETFDGHDVPMNEFVMVTMPDGYNGIFVKVDHRLLDSCGVTVMVNDIMELYCHFRFQAPFPEQMASYTDMLEKDLTKANNPKKAAKDEAYWKETFERLGEPLYSDITGPKVLEASRLRHKNPTLRAADREMKENYIDKMVYHLEGDATQNLMDFCMNHQVSMTNLILLGMRTYLSKQNDGQQDITIRNYIARRSTHAEWTSGGNRTVAFPCRTVIDPDMTFQEALLEIQDVQNHVYRHANYDPQRLGELTKELFPVPSGTSYESVGLTYQPMPVRLKNDHLAGIPVRSLWIPNGRSSQKVYLTVMHSADDLGLNFYFRYQTKDLSEHDIELFYYYLMRILFKGIAEPDMTIGEIMKQV